MTGFPRIEVLMPSATHRFITIRELSLAPARKRGSPPALLTAEMFRPLFSAVKAASENRAPLHGKPDARGRRLYLMHMTLDEQEKSAALLWTLADPTAAEQLFLSEATFELSAVERPPDHVPAVSAHMVIDFSVQPAHRLAVAMEDHEGIGSSAVVAALQEILRETLPEITAVTETGNSKQGEPKVVLVSYAGKRIADSDLTVRQIELVRLARSKAIRADSSDEFYEASSQRVFRPTTKSTTEKLRDAAIRWAGRLRSEHPKDRVRIVWRDPKGVEKDAVTQVEENQHVDGLLDRALARMLTLEGFTALPSASTTVVEPLRERMLKALREVLAEERPRK
jgi:hypothetical protein